MNRRVAFLGLGLMGAPMARAIAAGGFDVRAWNRSTEKAQALAEFGITPCASARAAATGADVAILMVSTGAVADAVLFEAGVADALQAGAVVVVMSSIPVETARAEAARLAERGVDYVDAPVSGGERGAIARTLSIMAGGAEETIAALTPLLSTMGRVTRVGPVGAGQLAKLANQTIVGVSIAAVAEALLLARAGGADIAAVLRALEGGFADSTILRQHGPRMAAGDFKPGGHASTQLKDLDTACALAGELGLSLSTLGHVRGLYAQMAADGLGDLDHSGLFRWIAARGG